MVSVSLFVIVFLKAERVVVLGFPDVLGNRRSEVLKNLKKLSENGPHPLFSNESFGEQRLGELNGAERRLSGAPC